MLNHLDKAVENYTITEIDVRLFEGVSGNNVLVLSNPPHFTILGVTESYLQETGKSRGQLMGKGLFEVFPANPDDETDTGENDLRFSFSEVIKHKKIHHLPTPSGMMFPMQTEVSKNGIGMQATHPFLMIVVR